MSISGIYKIMNKIDGNIYIGSSKDVNIRKSMHFSRLKNNKHSNKKLQNAYNKYGINNFEFFVIEYCKEEDLQRLEQIWLDILYTSLDNREFYNLTRYVDTPSRGIKRGSLSDETKRKISESQKGKIISSEHREKLRIAGLGKSSNNKGNYSLTEEQKDNIAIGGSNGKSYTIIDQSGIEHKVINIARFCRNNGIKDKSKLSRALSRRQKKYRNFVLIYDNIDRDGVPLV